MLFFINIITSLLGIGAILHLILIFASDIKKAKDNNRRVGYVMLFFLMCQLTVLLLNIAIYLQYGHDLARWRTLFHNISIFIFTYLILKLRNER